ncbi:hypothetical protein [Streptomyces sp. NBC_00443]|uniref:hypothetical protein n=1 Tax=Streptomyces sp. NBC_00443 TaxID=2975743 RepID=UPI002E24624D
MSAAVDVLVGVGGAVSGVALPTVVVAALERVLPSLSRSGVGRAEAAVAAADLFPRGVR